MNESHTANAPDWSDPDRSRAARLTMRASILAVGALASLGAAQVIVLNGSSLGRTFRGIGGLSAGASSRLLFDYPEPQRSQILDYLFLPNYGAGLQINKVEIGGDCQSTDGTEASHMHTREDLSFHRGYEWWLMAEAKKRNPAVKTYALSWGVPAWIGNGSFFTSDNWEYQTTFVRGALEEYNVTIDYIGIWNERTWGNADYVKGLRSTLDAAGFSSTRIIGADGYIEQSEISALQSDPDLLNSVFGLGIHYPCHRSSPETLALGLDFWANEDYSTVGDWAGASCWGRSINQNYVLLNATATIAWSTIWSVYLEEIYFGNGLMYAFEPWSGHYRVNSPIWTSAHIGQFSEPEWVYLERPGVGMLTGGGSYTVLVPPPARAVAQSRGPRTISTATLQQGDFSLVIETLEGNCLRCSGQPTQRQNLTFVLQGPLAPSAGSGGVTLQVWRTNQASAFINIGTIQTTPQGVFGITVDPDSMYTITTTTGQSKGTPAVPIPPSAAFPLPFFSSYDSVPIDSPGVYHADQGGSFEVAIDPLTLGSNQVLLQAVPQDPGSNAWVSDPLPITLVGSTWRDVTASVDALLLAPVTGRGATASPTPQKGNFVGLCGRVDRQYNAGVCMLVGFNLQAAGVVAQQTPWEDGCQWVVTAANATNPHPQQPQFGVLGAGPCPEGYNASGQYLTLEIALDGFNVDASLDGFSLGSFAIPVTMAGYAGEVALMSGYHYAAFDNLTVSGVTAPGSTLVDTFVTGSELRNDFDGFVGMAITIPVQSRPVVVLSLGRFCSFNASQVHNLSIMDATAWVASGGQQPPVLLGSVAQDAAAACTSPAANGMAYSALSQAVMMQPGATYFLVSDEHNGGDSFFGRAGLPVVYFRADLEIFDDQPQGVYYFQNQWQLDGSANVGHSYGPLDAIIRLV